MGGMLCAGSDKEGAEITNRPTTLMRRMAHGLMSERMQHIYLARRNRNGWVEDAGLKKDSGVEEKPWDYLLAAPRS